MSLQALYQRLKELDKAQFELLCFSLLKERHPDLPIRRIDGCAGDLGIDVFSGSLDERPIIWQCKHFPNGVRHSQKEQIKHSLRTALHEFRPRTWVLCIPVEFDIRTARWFQRLSTSYRSTGVELRAWTASDIVHELAHRRCIRDAFFPDAIVDSLAVREILGRTGEYADDELSRINDQNIDIYLSRLADRDARFAYQLVWGTCQNLDPTSPNLPLLSIQEGARTLNVFPRDLEALRLDPPKGHFRAKGEGANKILDFIRTGREHTLIEGEIESFTSTFDFLLPKSFSPSKLRLDLKPLIKDAAEIPIRLIFGAGDTAVSYEDCTLKLTRKGTEEAEFQTDNRNSFTVQIICDLRDPSRGVVHFSFQLCGAEVRKARKLLLALRALRAEPSIEAVNIRTCQRLFSASLEGDIPPHPCDDTTDRVIAEAAEISEYYGIELNVPDLITASDAVASHNLCELKNGIDILDEICFTFLKTGNTPWQQILISEDEIAISVELPVPPITLFGTPVSIGTLIGRSDKTRVINAAAVRLALANCELGDRYEVRVMPISPFRVKVSGKQAYEERQNSQATVRE